MKTFEFTEEEVNMIVTSLKVSLSSLKYCRNKKSLIEMKMNFEKGIEKYKKLINYIEQA